MRAVVKCVLLVGCVASALGLVCNSSGEDRGCCASVAITVRVVDATTGDRVVNATVTASDGVTTETLSLYTHEEDECSGVASADYRGVERAGSYTVHVQAEGYESVVIESILVPESTYDGAACEFVPVDWLVELNAAL